MKRELLDDEDTTRSYDAEPEFTRIAGEEATVRRGREKQRINELRAVHSYPDRPGR